MKQVELELGEIRFLNGITRANRYDGRGRSTCKLGEGAELQNLIKVVEFILMRTQIRWCEVMGTALPSAIDRLIGFEPGWNIFYYIWGARGHATYLPFAVITNFHAMLFLIFSLHFPAFILAACRLASPSFPTLQNSPFNNVEYINFLAQFPRNIVACDIKRMLTFCILPLSPGETAFVWKLLKTLVCQKII